MKFTENFNLNLPDLDDMADVEKLNENFRTIDTTMKSLETDPELAANVVEIKNKIGTEADADTQPTLFGRLAQLKNVVVEKLAEVLTKVTGIDGKIGTSGDTAGTATLFGQVKDILEKMPTGAVKSVQTIVTTGGTEVQPPFVGRTLDITISPVNVQKTMVLIQQSTYYSDQPAYLMKLATDKVTIRDAVGTYTKTGSTFYRTNPVSLQVIEFM